MSIFSNLMHKIFHTQPHGQASAQAAPQAAPAQAQVQPAQGAATPAAAAPAPQNVDVTAVMDGLVAQKGQTLDWRHSIVDMLKALDMDSSLQARKELAAELNYMGDTNDSAAMNIWLSKQVLQKLSENGGHVPAELLN
jgi:hypothetical protein